MSFFVYRLRLSKWWPTILTDQPYRLATEDRRLFYPHTDNGLGWKLAEDERCLSLKKLMDRYPPPPIPEPVAMAESSPAPNDFIGDFVDNRTAADFIRERITELEARVAELETENAALIATIGRLENGTPTDG